MKKTEIRKAALLMPVLAIVWSSNVWADSEQGISAESEPAAYTQPVESDWATVAAPEAFAADAVSTAPAAVDTAAVVAAEISAEAVVAPSPTPVSPQKSAELSKSPGEHEVDTAHDSAENDPSVSPHLKLDKVIKQDHLMVTGTLKSISNNVARGMVKYSPLVLPITLLQKRVKPLTYATAVKSRPELFNYFNIHKHRYTPKREYGPTLVNSDHEYEGISDRAHGYCWGFSTLVRYFTTLAFFDANQINFEPANGSAKRKEWLKFYYAKIDQVVRGEATVIPGFANFRELSLVPEFELYLKLNAMELWRSRAVKTSSLPIFKSAMESMTPKAVDEMVDNLEARIARGEMPKIIFSSLIPSETIMGMNTDIHVVLAYGVERLEGKRAKIKLWDINFYTETLVREPKFLEITAEHGILYQPWYEPKQTYAKGSDLVANIKIAPENDEENIQMLLSLKHFCKNPENQGYCLQND